MATPSNRWRRRSWNKNFKPRKPTLGRRWRRTKYARWTPTGAANYLSVGQIYLRDNPLLTTPLSLAHVKARLLGHWGTTPGLNFIYVHLNRVIKVHDLNVINITGPGHGGPGLVANTWLEGSYREIGAAAP